MARFVFKTWPPILMALVLASVSILSAQRSESDIRREEAEDYFDKWLKQDVVYIITDDERKVFERLTTPEEREQFIEQFWHRRDPDPRTPDNAFKEEHYRRIAYANEKFGSGDPGWRTDRGRIYIIHGPPDGIESRPTGGSYTRDLGEGGGVTSTYPFERWRYRYIEGLGNDIELEFVDSTFTNKYELAVYPWEKDALLHFPGAGRTLAEETGLANRADRPAYMLGGPAYGALNPNTMYRRYRDTPFQRYELIAKVQAPTPLKYPDLRELVQVDVSFENLPFEIHQEYFRLNEEQALIPLTVRVENRNLTFEPSGDRYVARFAVYGIVTSLARRIVMEFDDDVSTSFSGESLEINLQKSSIYQKILPLDQKMRYRLDLVVKDLQSGNVGVLQTALIPPQFREESLTASSLVISDSIEPLDEIPSFEQMFVLGDVKIRPNLGRVFSDDMPLGIYLQLYNVAVDQSTLEPSLQVSYRLLHNGELLRMAVEENGESIQLHSSQRLVLLRKLSLAQLPPGGYQVEVEVLDRLTGDTIRESLDFTLVERSRLALGVR